MNKRERLEQLQREIALEEIQEQIDELYRDAIVEWMGDGFVIHGYRSSVKAKPESVTVPPAFTLEAEGFWKLHCDWRDENLYQLLGEWLLRN